MTLSKSNYMDYLKHPAFLWLRKLDKYRLPPLDDATRDLFAAGNLFEKHAESLFGDAVRIGFDMANFSSYKNMPERTKQAMDDGAEVVLQGRLEGSNVTAIFDVLRRVEGQENTYDLIEIKSSSSAKPEHAYDLAFQGQVLFACDIKVRKYSVVHLNSEYVKDGEIDINQLATETDITEEVKELEEVTRNQIRDAFHTLELPKVPDLSPRHINQLGVEKTRWKDYWMDVFFHINNDLSPTSIYKLCRLNPDLVATLEDMEITDIKDIPEDLEGLHPKQVTQIQTTKSNTQIIDKENIKEFIDGLEYPLYFFDYETFSSVIPIFDGTSPYKDYPFQYSLHILDKPGGELRHEEYLHSENSNPMIDLINKLKSDIGDKGTILAWNMSYEKGCNDRMAVIYPESASFLGRINDRMQDLMLPFKNDWFADAGFMGSASIKNVLPVVVPELDYSELEVSDGLKAKRQWMQTVLEGKNQWGSEKILKELSEYCTLDTFAMVRILEELTIR